MHETSPRRTFSILLLGLALFALAGCESVRSREEPTPAAETPSVKTPAIAAAAPVLLPARRAGPLSVRAYAGQVAGDPRLPDRIDALGAAADRALALAADRAGLELAPGREPVLELVDEPLSGGSARAYDGIRVDLRLLDGVRRPLIRVNARDLASGRLVPGVHGAATVVEAALLGTFGDREAPPWLRAGLGVELTGGTERLLYERALGGPRVARRAADVLPDDPTDPLRAALRVRTLLRIAQGEAALARCLGDLRAGRGLDRALATVGVDDPLFLEAAEESTARRFTGDFESNGAVASIATARALLTARDAVGAARAVPELETETALPPYLRAEWRLTRADAALGGGDATTARELLQDVLSTPDDVLRLEAARVSYARAVLSEGDDGPRANALRALLRDHPETPLLPSLLGKPDLRVEQLRELGSTDARRRRGAVMGLAGADSERTIRLFLSDPDPGVREAALTALLRAAPDAAKLELTVAASDPDAGLCLYALTTLSTLDPVLAKDVAKTHRDDGNAAVRTLARRLSDPPVRKEAPPPKKDTKPPKPDGATMPVPKSGDEPDRGRPTPPPDRPPTPPPKSGDEPGPPPKPR